MEIMFDIEKTINDIKEYAELLDKYRALEEENKKLREDYDRLDKVASENVRTLDELNAEILELEEENRKLKERVDELEKCNLNLQERLDNKEKVNKSLREELEKLKSTYVYDAKQVRDIC